jgi:predicted nuclease of restriction endonuclease-like (RecB) superfamily
MADDLAPDLQSARLLDDVRAFLRAARTLAFAAANAAMVDAYWQIGRRILEEEQGSEVRAESGSHLIRNLARALGDEFGRGVSVGNLKNVRQFYLTFPDAGKGYSLRSELTWTHWRLVMRVENVAVRDHYIREYAEQAWSSRRLEREIATRTFDRLLAPPPAQAAPVPTDAQRSLGTTEFVKDPYVLEFLGLAEPFDAHERELETLRVSRLRDFLMELGKGFSFVGRQFRISTETTHFYVDLVFYNDLLKCFVLIDLKTSKLAHADIRQMDMYVRMFDDLKQGADKDETPVHYSVLKESQQLSASKCRLVLPSEEELQAELERRHVFELPGRDVADK